MSVRVRFLGSGDAFGAGGRFQTCILLEGGGRRVLVDCGATSLTAMRRAGVEPNSIDAILLTHLHGDHFGGVPFFILEAQLTSLRARPLLVAGPPETRGRIDVLSEALFPGMGAVELRYDLEVVELEPGTAHRVAGLTVTPHRVTHTEASNPTALRMECAGRTVTYTGDTTWTEALIPAAEGADLLIAECYFFDKVTPHHMTYEALSAHIGALGAKRVILTHMGADMLARVGGLGVEYAMDGMVVELG
jgi:ribonuclease BN (tRNA processing enzyme)